MPVKRRASHQIVLTPSDNGDSEAEISQGSLSESSNTHEVATTSGPREKAVVYTKKSNRTRKKTVKQAELSEIIFPNFSSIPYA